MRQPCRDARPFPDPGYAIDDRAVAEGIEDNALAVRHLRGKRHQAGDAGQVGSALDGDFWRGDSGPGRRRRTGLCQKNQAEDRYIYLSRRVKQEQLRDRRVHAHILDQTRSGHNSADLAALDAARMPLEVLPLFSLYLVQLVLALRTRSLAIESIWFEGSAASSGHSSRAGYPAPIDGMRGV